MHVWLRLLNDNDVRKHRPNGVAHNHGSGRIPVHPRRLSPRKPLDVDAWDWRVNARCRNEDPRSFFIPMADGAVPAGGVARKPRWCVLAAPSCPNAERTPAHFGRCSGHGADSPKRNEPRFRQARRPTLAVIAARVRTSCSCAHAVEAGEHDPSAFRSSSPWAV